MDSHCVTTYLCTYVHCIQMKSSCLSTDTGDWYYVFKNMRLACVIFRLSAWVDQNDWRNLCKQFPSQLHARRTINHIREHQHVMLPFLKMAASLKASLPTFELILGTNSKHTIHFNTGLPISLLMTFTLILHTIYTLFKPVYYID